MQALTAQGKNGPYTLPMMSHKYQLSTVAESNDKGNWFGWEINKVGPISLTDAEEANVFEMAVAFAKSVKAGEVEVKETAPPEPKDKGAAPDDDVPF